MQIDLDKINKLPPDVRDRFQKLLIKYKEEDKKELAQNDFLAFVKTIWPEFIEGEHHKTIADKFNKLASGEIKRLIVILVKCVKQVVRQKILLLCLRHMAIRVL